ncbi:putative cytochrome P450 CYP13A1 [Colletotrichum spaethianum]|uniref:Holocytochrome c-type synthase n=1 Tax=Colletotrichum spaethianum TaxID=700344 RepID=A0AA37PEW2_9PEZI|nr:putative cytochrome P450 CYP13A1 [Colletotrichum spaethianum]GKT50815.1 putative cytochrome P450 CYP13A1 [Colletotrichum spaethianum]
MNADLVDLVFLTCSQPPASAPTPSYSHSSAIDYENHIMSDPKNDAAPETCPVDHKAREAWLQHARAANPSEAHPHPPHPVITPADVPPPQSQSQSWTQSLLSLTPFSTPSPSPNNPATPSSASSAGAEACPVDHKSREAWLAQARAASAAANPHTSPVRKQNPHQSLDQASPQPSQSWTESLKSYIPFTSSSKTQDAPNPLHSVPTKPGLDTEREVSTIPRTATSAYPGNSRPSNHEQETGADEATGNWIYPSQKMFFDAMKRKGHDTRAADMATVVPIHNAVNERAWKEIKEWEKPYLEGTACDGPKLHSFLGLSTNMSPKARVNTLLGYTPPFDRHDWIVDRCGTQVEYVIDFYAGRPDAHGKPSFYLDVRPKLNSWEGVKMRALRGVGLA